MPELLEVFVVIVQLMTSEPSQHLSEWTVKIGKKTSQLFQDAKIDLVLPKAELSPYLKRNWMLQQHAAQIPRHY